MNDDNYSQQLGEYSKQQYEVEVRDIVERNPDYLSAENQNRDNPIFGYKKTVVVITPKKEELIHSKG